MLGMDVHIVCPDKKVGENIQTALHILEPGRQTYSEKPGHPFDITHDFAEETTSLDKYAGLIVSCEMERFDGVSVGPAHPRSRAAASPSTSGTTSACST